MSRIPSDGQIRNLLDGAPSSSYDGLLLNFLSTLRDEGGLAPFQRLGGRLLVALDGTEFHCSCKVHCEQCSVRHVGKDRTPQYFHSMLGAAAVADGHNLALPLPPEFILPQKCSAAADADRPAADRKQDCERNAAKRWLDRVAPQLAAYRPVYLGDDLFCCHPVCKRVLGRGADFLFVAKPKSHQRMYEILHEDYMRDTGWIRVRNAKGHFEERRCRWMRGVPVRDTEDAAEGTWVEFLIRRGGRQTYKNTFFTSLEVTRGNVFDIANAGRARWKIENESFNCLKRGGYSLEHNFGHGRKGLANLFAVINMVAFAMHVVLELVHELWRQCRKRCGSRKHFFFRLSGALTWVPWRDWEALLLAVRGRRRGGKAGAVT